MLCKLIEVKCLYLPDCLLWVLISLMSYALGCADRQSEGQALAAKLAMLANLIDCLAVFFSCSFLFALGRSHLGMMVLLCCKW
jgi:hypothetical protein